MSLWTGEEAAAATGGEARGDWAVDGVSIDTRTIAPGDLFVALKAARDGHEFVGQALGKGAGAALVTHVPEGVADDAPLLIVPDVLVALEDLARAARARTNARVIAVTGSVGKTSTKEMLRVVLDRQGKTHAAEASYNNHWGVPLTLARMPVETDFAIIEVGMNHPGEIAPLVQIARPHVAMITTVAPAHMEAFENIEGIAREKAAIFSGLEPGGIAIFNGDLSPSVLAEITAVAGQDQRRFGTAAECEYRLSEVTVANDATLVQAALAGEPVVFKLGCAGRHFAANALGSLAVVGAVGADMALAAIDIVNWKPPAGRGTRERLALDAIETDFCIDLFDDAFNANPTSVAAALEVVAVAAPSRPEGRRIAVLGDMLELGPTEVSDHQAIAALSHIKNFDVVHCIGTRMHHLWQVLPEWQRGEWAESAGEFAANFHTRISAGDVVLVKGSKGSRVSLVVDAIRKLGHEVPNNSQG